MSNILFLHPLHFLLSQHSILYKISITYTSSSSSKSSDVRSTAGVYSVDGIICFIILNKSLKSSPDEQYAFLTISRSALRSASDKVSNHLVLNFAGALPEDIFVFRFIRICNDKFYTTYIGTKAFNILFQISR